MFGFLRRIFTASPKLKEEDPLEVLKRTVARVEADEPERKREFERQLASLKRMNERDIAKYGPLPDDY